MSKYTFRDKLPNAYRIAAGRSLGVGVIALLLFAYYAWTWRSVSAAKAAIDTCGKTFCDFIAFYYPMGEAVFRTELPVEGFVYSPAIAILLSVFAPLGLRAALIVWGILQVLSIVLYLVLFHELVPARHLIQLFFTALLLSSFPLLHNLSWGQVGLFTTIAILGALVCYERGQHGIAAALLAFGLSFKLFPVIFLVPFAIRRDIRFLLITSVTCGIFLFLIPGVLLGLDGTWGFYSALLDSYQRFDWVITNYNSQFFPHVMLRLAEAAGYYLQAYLPVLRWIAYAVAALNMGLVFLIERARSCHANLWSFHILFLSIPFLLPTSWPVDLVYLPFGQTLLAWRLFGGEKVIPQAVSPYSRSPAVKATVALLLLASVIFSNIVFFDLLGNRALFGSAGFIFWANLLLLVGSYVELLPAALRQPRSTPRDLLLPGIPAASGQ